MVNLAGKILVAGSIFTAGGLYIAYRINPEYLVHGLRQAPQSDLELKAKPTDSLSPKQRDALISTFMGGRARLIPIDYEGDSNVPPELVKTENGIVQISKYAGNIWVNYEDGKSGFSLSNITNYASRYVHGKIPRLTTSGQIVTEPMLTIPKGYSVIYFNQGTTSRENIEGLLDGLGQFGENHPDSGINIAKIGVIKKTLGEFPFPYNPTTPKP